VAVKVISGESDPHLLARFRREAAATGALRHTNIVTVYEFGEHQGRPFIAMECLEGEDLQCRMAKGRPLSLFEKVRIMHQVAEGLHSAHQSGVVHRDIKPANIMLLPDGTVKVTDFGIARLTAPNATPLTQRGDLLGTVYYMSPEQFRDQEAVDLRSDISSYGVVYYELLTGSHPFDAADAAEVMMAISRRDPAPIRDLLPDCPEELERVVQCALQKEREFRFQSLGDLQLDVVPLLLRLQRQRAAALVGQAERAFSAGDLEEARVQVREILKLEPGSAEGRRLWDAVQEQIRRQAVAPRVQALLLSAERELAASRLAQVIDLLESVLRLDPANATARERLEQVRVRYQETTGRRQRLSEAGAPPEAEVAIAPRKTVARRLKTVAEGRRTSSRRKAGELSREAEEQLRQQNLTLAGKAAAAAVELTPEDPQPRQLVERIGRQIDQRRQQRQRRRPAAVSQAVEQARRLVAQDQSGKALAVLEKAQADYPDAAEFAHALERVRNRIRERERAPAATPQASAPQPPERPAAQAPILSREEFFRERAFRTGLRQAESHLRERQFSEADRILQGLRMLKPDNPGVPSLERMVLLERSLEQEPQAPEETPTLAGYRLRERLRSGSRGLVYRALDTPRNREVVLRLLFGDMLADTEAANRRLQQLEATAALEHPSIVHTLEAGEADACHFIAMEPAEGQGLDSYLRERRLQAAEIAGFAVQIAQALQKAQERGVTHGSLTSHNVVVTRQGGLRILDFGVGPAVADPQADLAALGLLLYEMGGARISPGISQRALQRVLPPALNEIARRCLAQGAEQGYQSAADLASDLRKLHR